MKFLSLFSCIVMIFALQFSVEGRILYFPRNSNNDSIASENQCLFAAHNYNHHGDYENCMKDCRYDTKKNEIVCEFEDFSEKLRVRINVTKPSYEFTQNTKITKVRLHDATEAKNNQVLYHTYQSGVTVSYRMIGKYFKITLNDGTKVKLPIEKSKLTKIGEVKEFEE